MELADLVTPALVVDEETLEANLATMARRLPGRRLRPHVKAHKCTALARRQLNHGHNAFVCATVREAIGLLRAGLGDDVLIGNEVMNPRLLAQLEGRATVAVDSEATISVAASGGIRRVLVDVNVGLQRCGCPIERAGDLAVLARSQGLEVRGVMGYEGHAVHLDDRAERAAVTEQAMLQLREAHRLVGGEIVSAGGTGTYELNTWATEIQAGSYALMDQQYARLEVPFRPALSVLSTVIFASATHLVADCGLKALAMDQGPPHAPGMTVIAVNDEHLVLGPDARVKPGDRIRVFPAHIDPTVAYHEHIHVVRDQQVIETWPIDLRGW